MNRWSCAIPCLILFSSLNLIASGFEEQVHERIEAKWREKLDSVTRNYETEIEKWREKETEVDIHRPRMDPVKKASRNCTSALKEAEEELGSDHLILLKARERVAGLHRQVSDFPAAAILQKKIVSQRNRLFGRRATKSVEALDTLANDVSLTGDRVETVRLRRLAYEIRKEDLGADDLRTLSSRGEYGVALMRAKEYQVGESEYISLIEQADRLCPDSFFPSQLRIDLASFLAKQGKQKEATEKVEAAWRGFTRTLGPDAPATKNALRMLNELRASDR